MAEGVILLNASGQVTDFNAAGRPWLAACGEARASLEKHIKRHAAELANGPCVVDVFGPQAGAGAAVEVHLCSNGPQSYALFIAPPLAAAPAPVSMRTAKPSLISFSTTSGTARLGTEPMAMP